tara:strand:+ start:24132 stop:25205 length:1074 start_codon:yes stop_codon:yes gene_type:complete
MRFENQYSLPNQWLHRLSFATTVAQVGLADIESRLFKKQLEPVVCERPVFVTALPRAGTTLLLNLLVGTGEFASHTYRDMPFVLCPMLWQRFASIFGTESIARERAHGDGVSVSLDSPEALEEIIWQPFWGGHYEQDRIKPWKQGKNELFRAFFINHMRKIIALRSPEGSARYASKNNMNIARLRALKNLAPDCVLIVPFREPLQHASSLLHQHRGFFQMHGSDHFAQRYMSGTGHFDFGENLRPINFGNWLNDAQYPDAMTLGFWLEYWVATYSHVLNNHAETANLLSFEELVSQPKRTLERIEQTLKLTTPQALTRQASDLRAVTEHPVDISGVSGELLSEANDIHLSLLEASHN